ncbi:hypothetical protein SLEP1_g31368 [Rubroshorea leprosula]|uniref:Uncharacterized protein n=1 Tax=Rubroshorea leprosula TaxID=152421 RepID=A0AAV5K362_9ROSI|nr:hypothetical protein SLEP1_g31368 [Rubroshorea leprosula]
MQLSCCEINSSDSQIVLCWKAVQHETPSKHANFGGTASNPNKIAGIAVQARTRDFKKGICLFCRVSNSAVPPFYLIREAIGKLNLFWYVYLPSAAIHQLLYLTTVFAMQATKNHLNLYLV